MTSHFLLLLLFSFLVALVFAVLMRNEPRDQVRFGAMVFGGFVLSAVVIGLADVPVLPLSGPVRDQVLVDSTRPESSAAASSRLSLWGPVGFYCALIFALSSISAVPALPMHVGDKVAHAALYAGFGFLVTRALAGGSGRPVTAARGARRPGRQCACTA